MVQTEQRLDNHSLLIGVIVIIIYRCSFPNGKMYIGQTNRSLHERIREHIRVSKIKTSPGYNYPFYRAIRKYGDDNLEWDILDTAGSQPELNERERYWISYYNTCILSENPCGYNQTYGGEGQNGLKHTDASKEKIRQSELGESNANAKLSRDQVLEIVRLSKEKQYSQVALSKMFRTSEGTISRILSGLRWGSVTGIRYIRKSVSE